MVGSQELDKGAMKGVTYLEAGYIFAPYVSLTDDPKMIATWFEKSPQPGDLVAFHIGETVITGLCLKAWLGDDKREYGECLMESGDIVMFYGASVTSYLEVISSV